ncbi:MAG: hypothetical protein KAS02_00945 [Candidatus Pacebacteria bacterium]|nr:hypothetical protein [Candidatus Paceibacterota bacterium]
MADPFSPQQLETRNFDYTRKDHPVRKIIEENIGSFDINVSVKEDKENLSLLKTPGLIFFLCLLKVNNKVIGSGRGSSRINKDNKLITRAVRFAFGASILDAVAKTVRTSNFLRPNKKEATPFSIEDLDRKDQTTKMITNNQKRYLLELIHSNISDDEQIVKWESNLEDFTKQEASEAIQKFKN